MNLNRPPDAAPGDSRRKHAAGVIFRTPHIRVQGATTQPRPTRQLFANFPRKLVARLLERASKVRKGVDLCENPLAAINITAINIHCTMEDASADREIRRLFYRSDKMCEQAPHSLLAVAVAASSAVIAALLRRSIARSIAWALQQCRSLLLQMDRWMHLSGKGAGNWS